MITAAVQVNILPCGCLAAAVVVLVTWAYWKVKPTGKSLSGKSSIDKAICKRKTQSFTLWYCKRLFIYTFVSKLAEDKPMQVLVKAGKIFCQKICRPGQEEREKPLLNGQKAVFCVSYLKGHSHLRGYCTWLSPKCPEMPRWQKRDEKGTNNQEGRCLTSYASWRDACLLTDSPGPATWDLPLPLGLALSLPAYCLRLVTLLLLSPCAFTSDHQNGMQQEGAGSWWWVPLLYVILASFLSFLLPAFPFPSCNSHWHPLLYLPGWLRFVINCSDQHLNCFLISRQVYMYQRSSSPSYKLEWDRCQLSSARRESYSFKEFNPGKWTT